jgi:aspartate/methionine/tyrosine aminotransferase
MVQMRRFEVEVWMDRLEVVPNVLNVAETCCDSVSIQDLERLSKGPSFDAGALVGRRLTYGAIPGSETTRRRIAALYDEGGESGELLAQQVVLTPGAIMANYLVFYSLVGPGDHVVCVYPTYQQLYDVPKSMGAEVSLWRLREDRGWLPDLEELEELVKPNTKVRLAPV